MRIVFVVLLIGIVGYLLAWPTNMEPRVYAAPKPPGFVGDFAENAALDAMEIVPMPEGSIGPEDLAVMIDGRILTTDLTGRLFQVTQTGVQQIDDLGGRPLGLNAGPDGVLYIADSFRGILKWRAPGQLDVLVKDVEGQPLIYANQLDVAADGTIYFSNSTDRFDPEFLGGTKPTSVMTVWEQSDAGYVARRNPDGSVEKLASGFVYTNGVALSQDEEFLLIAETGRANLHRLWLKGERAGQVELLMENLPGYPDNIEAQEDGTFWVAFASPRVPTEFLMPYPFLRKVIWRLGPMVRPAPIHRGMVMQIDGEGQVLRQLQDPTGRLGITTGARLIGDVFYVTTLDSAFLARMPSHRLPVLGR